MANRSKAEFDLDALDRAASAAMQNDDGFVGILGTELAALVREIRGWREKQERWDRLERARLFDSKGKKNA